LARLLLIFLIGFIAYFLIKSYIRKLNQPPKSSADPAAAEKMVRCAQCGIHLPQADSVSAGQEYFCSEEHRRLHVKK
jgi:uncharacterized protein